MDKKKELMRHSIILMTAAQLANVCNVVFHALMGRLLSKDEYGILGALLGFILICFTPLDALRTSAAHFTAKSITGGETGRIRIFMRVWVKRIGLMSGLILCLTGLSLVGNSGAHFFRLSSNLPIIVTGLSIAVLMFLPLQWGVLQGMQSFIWMSVAMHGLAIVRLVVGLAVALTITRTSLAGLSGQAIGIATSLLVGYFVIRRVTRRFEKSDGQIDGAGRYFIQSLIVLLSYAILMQMDVVFVRHYLPDEAGTFTRAAVLARAIIFLPMPIAFAVFPKLVSTTGIPTAETRRNSVQALIMVGGLILLGAVAGILFPAIGLRILYNEKSAEAIHYVRLLAVYLAPVGLVYILANIDMAENRFKSMIPVIGSAILYIALTIFNHDTISAITMNLGIASATAATILMAGFIRRHVL